jgi:shikimate dehydrogenase
MTPWAEVIGQPIGHSLSPIIHRYWLEATGIEGGYEASAVPAADLPAFLAARRNAAGWRGCNVTAPHKEAMLQLLNRVDEAAAAIGAVNCVHWDGPGLTGTNTDVEGIGEALAGLPIRGEPVAVIGAGGAARAAVHWLRREGARAITPVVRRPEAAEALGSGIQAYAFGEARQAFSSASLIINATPQGLEGGEAMSAALLDAVREARVSAAFDMVYRPLETPFLRAARDSGARTVDGLVMLIGQARRSFALFFGAAAPLEKDAELRALITTSAT